MPMKPVSVCGTYGCNRLRPCALHPKKGRWDGRGSFASRYPGHRQWRAEVLRRHPFCTDPDHAHPHERRVATVADHIVPLCEGGARLDIANGTGLCTSCSATKSGREGQRRRG